MSVQHVDSIETPAPTSLAPSSPASSIPDLTSPAPTSPAPTSPAPFSHTPTSPAPSIPTAPAASKQVCFQHVGCYNNAPPFDNANLRLPKSPTDIGKSCVM